MNLSLCPDSDLKAEAGVGEAARAAAGVRPLANSKRSRRDLMNGNPPVKSISSNCRK